MLWFILIIMGIILISFGRDSSKQATKVIKQGGMKTKYRTLINLFLELDHRMAITKETNSFISVGMASYGGSVVFFIHQVFGKVTIEWKTTSALTGKHELQWTFDEFMDQHAMFNKMDHDIGKYNENVMSNYM